MGILLVLQIFNQLEFLGASMMKVGDRLNHIEARTSVLQDAMRLNSQHLRIVRKTLSRSFGHRSPYLRKFSQKQKKAQTDSAEVRRSPSVNPYHPLDDDEPSLTQGEKSTNVGNFILKYFIYSYRTQILSNDDF